MKVKVANNLYQMSREKYKGLLKIAGEQVPFGIYAVKKNGYAELRNDKCESITQLKRTVRSFRADGYKVYANRGTGNGG